MKFPHPTAICLVTDTGYAFPTAVVAKSLMQMAAPNIGPIYFVWVDKEAPPGELIHYLETNGIILVAAQNSLLRSMKPAREGYVTPASAARLFLADVLEKFPIDKFLCLDGDIEITRLLNALAEIDLPSDHIAAADDYGTLFAIKSPKTSAVQQKELLDLGMPKDTPYFNSGVILAHMQSWAKISAETQKFHHENARVCTFFEQCALNAVSHDRRLVLSPKWNFQAPLFFMDIEADIKPAIVHFTGPHKPWGSVPFARPWQTRKPFLAARGELPELWGKTALRSSLHRSFGLYKKLLNRHFKKNNDDRRRVFLDYMANTRFVDDV